MCLDTKMGTACSPHFCVQGDKPPGLVSNAVQPLQPQPEVPDSPPGQATAKEGQSTAMEPQALTLSADVRALQPQPLSQVQLPPPQEPTLSQTPLTPQPQLPQELPPQPQPPQELPPQPLLPQPQLLLLPPQTLPPLQQHPHQPLE